MLLGCAVVRQEQFEAICTRHARHACAGRREFDGLGCWKEDSDQDAPVRLRMQPQHFERVVMRTGLHPHDRCADDGQGRARQRLKGGIHGVD